MLSILLLLMAATFASAAGAIIVVTFVRIRQFTEGKKAVGGARSDASDALVQYLGLVSTGNLMFGLIALPISSTARSGHRI